MRLDLLRLQGGGLDRRRIASELRLRCGLMLRDVFEFFLQVTDELVAFLELEEFRDLGVHVRP